MFSELFLYYRLTKLHSCVDLRLCETDSGELAKWSTPLRALCHIFSTN